MTHPSFRSLNVEQLQQVLALFPFRRRIIAVHLHHTWRPNHSQYRGHETILGMWRHHTQELDWSDIAQHLTIAPDGALWTGRDWNVPPASSKGFNGNSEAGPFMIEMIGDFDVGRDRLERVQRKAVVETIAQLHEFFSLKDDTLTFHNALSGKTCPGNSIDRKELLKDVQAARSSLRQSSRVGAARGLRPFSDRALAVTQVVEELTARSRAAGAGEGEADAELPESGRLPWLTEDPSRGAATRGEFELTPEILAELAPHVINLSDGRLSTGGAMTSEPGDVRAIFEDHLPRAFQAAEDAKRPLRIVFYAHGGLVSEKAGLGTTYKHLEWWRRNGVYPISFVWETGLWETLRSLILGRRARAGARDLVPDRMIEELVRLPGRKVWSGMKRSAARAVDSPTAAGAPPESYGGARFAAELLAAFLAQHQGNQIELHAVGHSAGSIFHSHFLPTALDVGTPGFAGTYFLAPAITVEAFERRLAELAGGPIGPVTIFTMKKAFELADEVFEVYDRSLLYLIERVLEPARRTPLLGLEVSLRDNSRLRKLFGLDGSRSAAGELVWSVTTSGTGRNASTSRSHGGFDDDAPTMNSVLRRILGVGDDAEIQEIDPYLEDWRNRFGARMLDAGLDEELADEMRLLGLAPVAGVGVGGGVPAMVSTPSPGAATSGRRYALCVGIDRYATSPLSGCVADAEAWTDLLGQIGFETPAMLRNEEATRSAILGSLEVLLSRAQPGDVVVFQYAGHGTYLPDVDGDDEGATDEALCPIDWEEGHALIDDDLADVFARIQSGVNVTVFMDCCHSGTNTRVAVGAAEQHSDPSARRRSVVASPEMRDRHVAFRRRLGASRSQRRGPETMREVSFAACQPWEVAWESSGHGEFTVRATELLRKHGTQLSHEEFERRVQKAFGPSPRQRPRLDCAPVARARTLLEPIGNGNPPASSASGAVTDAPCRGGKSADAARLLRAIADTVG